MSTATEQVVQLSAEIPIVLLSLTVLPDIKRDTLLPRKEMPMLSL